MESILSMQQRCYMSNIFHLLSYNYWLSFCTPTNTDDAQKLPLVRHTLLLGLRQMNILAYLYHLCFFILSRHSST